MWARDGLALRTDVSYRASNERQLHRSWHHTRERLVTWDRLRHLHKEPSIIEAWLGFFRPILRWLTPSRRRLLLCLGGLYIAAKYSVRTLGRLENSLGSSPSLMNAFPLLLVLFAFVLVGWLAAKRFASLPLFVRRHPQICLHAILWSLLVVAWIGKPGDGWLRTLLFGCIFALPFLLWRVGYMMFTAQRGKIAGTKITDHFFYIFPYWGGSDTPYGKGFDYLAANEARDETALAKSQLAGLKCFVLAALWAVTKIFLVATVFVKGGVPRMEVALANPELFPIWIRWMAVYLELIWTVLSVAVTGHLIIGWLRFFGFHVFRSTYKPLLSESIIEFWNRYYYYFKELLVNFFFYPIFTRHFKGAPRLRVFAAVFAAAFVGNMYYHWLRLDTELALGDFRGMWAVLEPRFFYCFLLAVGISVSMVREQKRLKGKLTRSIGRRAVAIFGVWTFFGIIHIWALRAPASFMVRTKFFLGLLGLG